MFSENQYVKLLFAINDKSRVFNINKNSYLIEFYLVSEKYLENWDLFFIDPIEIKKRPFRERLFGYFNRLLIK